METIVIKSRIIEWVRFTYSPLGKAFAKLEKKVEEEWKTQIKLWKSLELFD